MSTSLISSQGRPFESATPSKPLDETVWQAWLAKNRVEERRKIAARIKLLKVIAFLLLLALVVLWQMRSSSPNRRRTAGFGGTRRNNRRRESHGRRR